MTTKSLEERVRLLEIDREVASVSGYAESYALEAFAELVLAELAAQKDNPAAYVREFMRRLREELDALVAEPKTSTPDEREAEAICARHWADRREARTLTKLRPRLVD